MLVSCANVCRLLPWKNQYVGYDQWFYTPLKADACRHARAILIDCNIRRIRVAQGIAQERLAFDASVDRSYLGGMERGQENPTVEVLERIATTLAVHLGELFLELDGSEQPNLPSGRKARLQRYSS